MIFIPIVVYGTGWVMALVLAPHLARRGSAAKAWGWLAILFALPWAGVGLYLLFGRDMAKKRRGIRYRRLYEQGTTSPLLEELQAHACPSLLNPETACIARLAESCGALPVVTGNTADLLNSNDTHQSLLEMIETAKKTVHLNYYIFRNDSSGQDVVEALVKASRNGVMCRVLVDALGSRVMLRKLAPRLRHDGVEVRASLPFNPLRKQLARYDLRNHRKIAVADSRVALLGSWNIGQGRVGPSPTDCFKDLTARLRGPVVAEVEALFFSDWLMDEAEPGIPPVSVPTSTKGQSVLQVLPSGPMFPSPAFRDLVVYSLHQARERIALVTPYFVPDEPVLLALRLAAQRGVRVDLVVPESTDHILVDSARRSYVRELETFGVSVHCDHQGVLHAKAMTVDQSVGIIGSSNQDLRSFHLNVEANLVLYSQPDIQRLQDWQDGLIEGSFPPRASGSLYRIGQDLSRLLGPLM